MKRKLGLNSILSAILLCSLSLGLVACMDYVSSEQGSNQEVIPENIGEDTDEDTGSDIGSIAIKTCEDNPCDLNAQCFDANETFGCACQEGFEGEGFTCTNIDECAEDTHDCSDNATCTDISGSYECNCNEGFEGDGQICTELSECDPEDNGCHLDAYCKYVDHIPTCECKTGFTGNGASCVDINECSTDNDGCDDDATCTNTPGGHECTCNAGFAGNGIECTQLTVCDPAEFGCHANAVCNYVNYQPTCQCKSGYLGDGSTSCEDIDECANGTDNCFDNAECINSPGGFDCSCWDCPDNCSTTDDCGTDYYCSNTKCVLRAENGTSCTADDQCQTGFCKEGYYPDTWYCADEDVCPIDENKTIASTTSHCNLDETWNQRGSMYYRSCTDGAWKQKVLYDGPEELCNYDNNGPSSGAYFITCSSDGSFTATCSKKCLTGYPVYIASSGNPHCVSACGPSAPCWNGYSCVSNSCVPN